MVEPNPADLIAANERSLKSLERAIALSGGQFSLCLACCNYKVLQEQILQRLEEIFWGKYHIQKLVLPQNVRSFYTTIHLQLQQQPYSLMILGLESVTGLNDLLSTINHVRDEFRKQHPFPMVVWVNDSVLQKMVRLAPDFASWAATPIRFEMTTSELLKFIQLQTDSLFATALNPSAAQHKKSEVTDYSSTFGQWEHSKELHFAIKQLQSQGINLEPQLNASLQFVFGLDDYVSDRIDSAKAHFHQSLLFWQQSPPPPLLPSPPPPLSPSPPPPHLLRQGALLFYIGLCYYRQGERNHLEKGYWQQAKSYFQQSLEIFDSAGRPDIIARFISQLAEVLQHLEAWSQLQIVAEDSLELHEIYGSQIQLACDYGFLAEVALVQSKWAKASQLARVSLWKLSEAPFNSDNEDFKYNLPHQGLFPLLLEQMYRLFLAKAQRHLGEEKIAAEYLKNASLQLQKALENSDYRYDVHRYIRLLRKLRSLYFEEGLYLEAFCIRHKRRSVEQQYGLRAFIGAGRLQPQRQATNPVLISPSAISSVALEIAASGRERDINQLIGRISRSDQKLTVIHGQSGVGKSSTVTAGLVPALQNRAIGDQIAVPVVLQIYTDWVRELSKSLKAASADTKAQSLTATPDPATPIIADITQQLHENANNHLITVLIFDQFEEFFFACKDRDAKQEFDKFLSDSLNISFVKVIFSLREDYLHHLLEFKHLAALELINHNILDKNIRYQLNNFSPQDAKIVIHKLTERSQFNLEPALIDVLVEDLSAELGEVRPIELQVLGAQLQDKRITTLKQYQPFRYNKLIQQYIKEIIEDCGKENEPAALLVLYLLTDENRKRPFKTRDELAAQLAELEDAEQLDLVLEILVRSGLVVLFHDVPERYQLIHDYLVDWIRYLQQAESNLQAQVNQLRQKVQQSQAEIARLNSELRQKKQQANMVDSNPPQRLDLLTELKELRKKEELSQVEIQRLFAQLEQQKLEAELADKEKQRINEYQLNRILKVTLSLAIVAILALTASISVALFQWRQALIIASQAASASSEALLAIDKDIDALKQGIKAGRKLQKAVLPDTDTQEQVRTALYQVVYNIKERNRLQKHTSGVNSVFFSSGSLIASASADNTIQLWRADGKWLHTLKGHTQQVNSVSINSDRVIASGSADKTVKLWSRDGRPLKTLVGHGDVVNSVSISPDGKIIASASSDKTVKLWSRDGRLLKTLSGHGDAVLGIAWSPDGTKIASASSDKTVKFWSLDGKLLKTLQGHGDAVLGVAWSPDGTKIASASNDKTVKLWSRDGKLLKTFNGHRGGVTSVIFNPNGTAIASASTDKTVKLWSLDGRTLETLNAHSDWVTSVSFSPDGRTLASASLDTTIKLWRPNDVLLKKLKKHTQGVTAVSFSPQGDLIASASEDKTVTVSSRDGKLLNTFQGHSGKVWDVRFNPQGNILASASTDKTVKLWRRDGTLIDTLSGHADVVLSVAWSPQGDALASASKDKTVKLWSRDGKLLKTLSRHSDAVNWVAWSPDGKIIVSASDDNTVKIWSRDGRLLETLKGHSRPVFAVAWSPDGSTIASAGVDSMVKLWSRDGRLLRTFMGDGDGFSSVTISPDGQTIAVASDDKVRLWQPNGTLLITLKGQTDEFTSVSFSPDGKMAVGTASGTVILHNLSDMKLENLLTRGCNWLQDYLNTNSKEDRTLCPGR